MTTITFPTSTGWSRFFGSLREIRESSIVALAMLAVASAYQYVSIAVTGYPFHWGEFLGTWTGLTCVWLFRTENIHSWPFGIISVLALGWFFRDIGLPGQQWLNWGFFMIIQLWAWPNWAFGGEDKSELPITLMSWSERLLAIAAVAGGTYIVYLLIDQFAPGSQYPVFDALVVSASVIAQLLLGMKKVESWWLWFGPVNVVSIILFTMSGAYTLTALYLAFLIHAGFALRSWYRAEAERS